VKIPAGAEEIDLGHGVARADRQPYPHPYGS
jgi:hypothetical protein